MTDAPPDAVNPIEGGDPGDGVDRVPPSERAFYVDEFAGETLVAALGAPGSCWSWIAP